MKILCTGDLHINDWMEYSTIDSAGRPSRLINYLKLADEISSLCEREGVDNIVIAGDISESSIQRPRVHDVIGDFLRKLSWSGRAVHLIHGQHDCDSKEESSMKQNSILTEICKDLQDYKVYYYPEPTEIEIGGLKFYFQGWNQNHTLPDVNADVFVGHGMVKGCTNLEGYVFVNGFDQDDLLEKYSLSIIGDIHNKQTFWSKDESRVVLQPGAPIQNTWKDAEKCGLWIADIAEDNVDLQFFNIHDLAPDTFHRFTYDEESTDLVHSRPRIKAQSKKKKPQKVEVKRDISIIRDTCLSLTKDNPKLHPLIEEVFENTSLASSKVISKTKVLKVVAKNFLSVNEFELDFEEFPDSCVVVGKNGHGKSTISEAIYWCLTGNTTKDIPMADIPNTYIEADSCSVKIDLEVNGQKMTISRGREGKSGSLSIINSEGEVFRRGSMRETQQEIYAILGLKEWQIFMFSYFSAEDTPIFSDLGESAKNDLISQIVGLDFVESMREYSKAKKSEAKTEKSKTSGALGEKETSLRTTKVKLQALKDDSERKKPEIEKKLKRWQASLQEALAESENTSDDIDLLYSKVKVTDKEGLDSLISRVSKKYHSLQGNQDTLGKNRCLLETSLRQIDQKINKADQGLCPTCNQSMCDDSVLSKLEKEKDKIFQELKDIPPEDDINAEVEKLGTKLGKLEKLRQAITRKSINVHKLEKEIADYRSEIKDLKLELNNGVDSGVITHLEEEVKELDFSVSELTSSLADYQQLEDSWKYLESTLFKRSGELAKELNKQGAVLIQACMDEIAVNMPVSFRIGQDLKLSAKFHNNIEVNYCSMSSGQRRLTDILMMVSLNNLFSKIYGLEDGVLGLAVYDEILSFLDEQYVQLAKHFVDQSMSRKMLIITHDYALINMYDSRINVKMTKTGSEYLKSWG